MARLSKAHKALFLLILITFIWGFAFIPTAMLLQQGFSSEMVMFVRFSVGALAIVIFAFNELKKMTYNDFKVGIMVGVCIFLAIYLQNLSMIYTTVSKTAFISGMSILVVPFFAYFINKKEITNVHVNGILIAFTGIGIFSLNLSELNSFNIGDVIALVSTLGFALQIVILERSTNINAICVSFVQVCFVAIGGLILSLINQADFSYVFISSNIPLILFLGVLATGFCYVIQVWVAKHISSIIVIVIIGSQAIVAFIFDIIVFDVEVTARFIIGATLITYAIFYLTLRKPKKTLFKRN